MTVTSSQIDNFRKQAVEKMKEMGATDDQIALIRDGSIKYAITNKRKPEDLVWAILQ